MCGPYFGEWLKSSLGGPTDGEVGEMILATELSIPHLAELLPMDYKINLANLALPACREWFHHVSSPATESLHRQCPVS